jgi:REP element-mobilizing transposase RayT
MPDHIHLLFVLGETLTLSQCIARIKNKARAQLHAVEAEWQDNFYDRLLRPDDSIEATIRYMWLNPYVANLISPSEQWPWFHCCPDDWEWFSGLTDAGIPFPAWLK